MHKRNLLVGIVICVILRILAWISPYLGAWNPCDWYIRNIFPFWYNTYARFSNLFAFSVGELLIILGIVLFIAMFGILAVFPLFKQKKGYRAFIKKFFLADAYIFVAVFFVMTLNCTLLYHATPLVANYEKDKREYTVSELELLRNYVVSQCNAYSGMMERDEQGNLLYRPDMQEGARNSLHNIAEAYPNLAGYYPNVKHMFFSDLMSQAYMEGYYFPFSMEANCNDNMYIANYPEVYCHELSHLHGYIYEDEANFLSFLACVRSGDAFFEYSGYLGVLYYLDNAYWESIGQDSLRYAGQPVICGNVYYDKTFLTESQWEKVEKAAVVSTETLDRISDSFTDKTLQLNGVEEGIASYGEVVELLLWYYDGKLY